LLGLEIKGLGKAEKKKEELYIGIVTE